MDMLAQMLRAMGAPEEVITAFLGDSDEDRVSEAFRKLEKAIDGHAESGRFQGNRTEEFLFLYEAWVQSLRRTFTEGGVSFKSIGSAMAAMEYRIMELENILRQNGIDVPREPSVKPEESNANENGNSARRCPFCGDIH